MLKRLVLGLAFLSLGGCASEIPKNEKFMMYRDGRDFVIIDSERRQHVMRPDSLMMDVWGEGDEIPFELPFPAPPTSSTQSMFPGDYRSSTPEKGYRRGLFKSN